MEDNETRVADRRGEGDGVVPQMRELAEDGRATRRREDAGGEVGGGGVEEVAVGVFAVVVAAGVVIAESEVDGGVWKGLAELESDEGYGLGGEGGVLGGSGGGIEGMEPAVELMDHEVAGDGDQKRLGLPLASGAEAGMEQRGGCVDALGVAGFLEVSEVCRLGGRCGTVENGCPAGRGRGEEGGDFGGIVEGIEVDIREEKRGHGVRGERGRLGLRG